MADAERRPLYSRVLRLRRLRPGGLMCFVLFEGSILLAGLLSMAELVSWWSVLILPLAIALMVKMNDMVAGGSTAAHAKPSTRAISFARLGGGGGGAHAPGSRARVAGGSPPAQAESLGARFRARAVVPTQAGQGDLAGLTNVVGQGDMAGRDNGVGRAEVAGQVYGSTLPTSSTPDKTRVDEAVSRRVGPPLPAAGGVPESVRVARRAAARRFD